MFFMNLTNVNCRRISDLNFLYELANSESSNEIKIALNSQWKSKYEDA